MRQCDVISQSKMTSYHNKQNQVFTLTFLHNLHLPKHAQVSDTTYIHLPKRLFSIPIEPSVHTRVYNINFIYFTTIMKQFIQLILITLVSPDVGARGFSVGGNQRGRTGDPIPLHIRSGNRTPALGERQVYMCYSLHHLTTHTIVYQTFTNIHVYKPSCIHSTCI